MASSSAIPEAIVVSTMAILSDKLLALEKEQGSDMAYEYREVVEMTDHVSPITIRIGIFLPDVVRRASFSTKERMDQTLKEYFKTMVSRGLRKVRKVAEEIILYLDEPIAEDSVRCNICNHWVQRRELKSHQDRVFCYRTSEWWFQ